MTADARRGIRKVKYKGLGKTSRTLIFGYLSPSQGPIDNRNAQKLADIIPGMKRRK